MARVDPSLFIPYLRAILAIRLINAFWVVTFFQPDEFFQALEPAWQLAFGPDSGAWITWEWQHQLRSSLHPAIFSAAYIVADYASKLLPQALRHAVIIGAPRVLQGIFAAVGDWYTWQLAMAIYDDPNDSSFVLFLQIFSPWQWYCSVRTFSNSLETTLTAMALYYYPWHELFADEAAGVTKENPIPANSIIRRSGSLRACFALAALAIVLRPTNVLIWATVVGMTLARLALGPSSSSQQQQQHAPGLITVLFREALLCGSLVVGGSLVADRLYFGFWTFPPYNWLTFNISQSLAVFYGRNPWHYYLLQGLPLLSTTTLPFVLYGLYKPAPSSSTPSQVAILRTLSYAVFVTIGALSLISHKEVRFIYPLLPILNILAAPVAMRFITKPSSTPSPSGRVVSRKNLLRFGIGLNVALAGYLSMYHQSAPLSVLRYLRSEFERLQPVAAEDQLFALFLMPCHSTPWRSHLVHPNLQAYALSCEPPLNTLPNTPERDLYRDEADRFYDDPSGFLAHELFAPGQSLPIPRYIAGFEGIEPWITDFLDNTSEGRVLNMKLRPVWSGFNGLFHEDWRRAGRIIVWDTGVYSNPPKSLKLG